MIPDQQPSPMKRQRREAQQHQKEINKKAETEKTARGENVKSVMFVPYTAHSELATRLRESEERLEVMTGFRLKIGEKVGMKLVDVLHKADPTVGGRDA